jgi:hypothetical protein
MTGTLLSAPPGLPAGIAYHQAMRLLSDLLAAQVQVTAGGNGAVDFFGPLPAPLHRRAAQHYLDIDRLARWTRRDSEGRPRDHAGDRRPRRAADGGIPPPGVAGIQNRLLAAAALASPADRDPPPGTGRGLAAAGGHPPAAKRLGACATSSGAGERSAPCPRGPGAPLLAVGGPGAALPAPARSLPSRCGPLRHLRPATG